VRDNRRELLAGRHVLSRSRSSNEARQRPGLVSVLERAAKRALTGKPEQERDFVDAQRAIREVALGELGRDLVALGRQRYVPAAATRRAYLERLATLNNERANASAQARLRPAGHQGRLNVATKVALSP